MRSHRLYLHHLTRMQRRGLVERRDCPADGRGTVFVLTDAGRDVVERAAPGHVGAVRRPGFDGMTPDQVAQLAAVM